MAGYGTQAWCRLVLLCSFQAALAADVPQKHGSQCPVVSPGSDFDGRVPLYVGIFPEEENWKWKMEFKNNESKTFFRLDLQSGKEQITAQATSGFYSETQSPPVEWRKDAFPLREWSHLAVYADGDHLVLDQRQDAGVAAVRVNLGKHLSTSFRIASNGTVTHNCMEGHDVTSVSELLQVSENKTYCLQAAGPAVTLSDGNASLTVTNTTWHQILEQAANYSVSGVIFVIENCSANAFMSTALTTEISTTTSEEATTAPTTDLTNPTTHQSEQSESSLLPTTSSRPQDAETKGPSSTSRFSSTPTLNADNAGTSTPGQKRTEPSDGPSGESSEEQSRKPSGESSEEPSRKPSGESSEEPSEGPSGESSEEPSRKPSGESSEEPSRKPSGESSEEPSEGPSGESSEEPSRKPSGESSEEPSGKTSGKSSEEHSQGPSKGAVAAVVITLIILLLTVILFIKRGYHREVVMLWHNATHREEQPVEILNLQKGGSLRQKEDNE